MTTSTYKLGKTAARPEAVKLKLANYLDLAKLPPLKPKVGHPGVLKGVELGMLGNDQWGDCVFAGAAHETMLLNLEQAKSVQFSAESVLSDYSALTGFTPYDPNTDQGTDMKEAASYRRKTGVIDAAGNRHKIAAYLSINPGNIEEMKYAIYLFGVVGIGIKFPTFAMDQFNAGKGWSLQSKHASIEGGHYIPGVYADTNGFQIITWGKTIRATNAFLKYFTDEAIAYVSEEFLNAARVSIDGFKYEDLIADLALVARA